MAKVTHHRGSASPEVGDLVFVRIGGVEHDLELARVGVVATGRMNAGRDRVADRADLDQAGALGDAAVERKFGRDTIRDGALVLDAVREAGDPEKWVDRQLRLWQNQR